MLSSWFSKKKNTIKGPEPRPSFIEDTGHVSFLARRQSQQLNLNVDDFISCFKQALAQLDMDVQFADQWCQPNRFFTFNFDEPTLGPTVFDGISVERVQLDEVAEAWEYQCGVLLRRWFGENQEVCEATLAIALQLLRDRKARNQALTEEPEVITREMFPIFAIFLRKPEEKPMESHIILSADPTQRTLLHITAIDFYTSITQALTEVDDRTVDINSWLHTGALYTFAFGQEPLSDVPGLATFNAITSTVGGHEDHIIDAKWLNLHHWFVEHPDVLQRAVEIAKEKVEEQSRTKAALEDEGVHVGREDIE